MADRELHLALNTFPLGTHPAAWRRDNGDTRGPVDLDRYREIAQVAERGLFDAIFFADALTVGNNPSFEPCWFLEPTILIAALAQVTEEIGFVASYSTTYSHPYNVARLFASLDHVTGGRVGWNVVTSYDERAARNFGDASLPEKNLRYRRAEEFVDVVKALWASWEEGAVLSDKNSGVLIDYERVHAIDHVGEFFAVEGPLQVPHSPQGQPMIFQAGGSPAGRDLAARNANGIFSAQLDLESAIAYRDDIHARAERLGRGGEKIAVMPGLSVVVGSTDAEAHSIRDELDALGGVPDVQVQLARFAQFVGVDPQLLSLDAPVPVGLVPTVSTVGTPQGFRDAIQSVLADPKVTLREALSKGVGHRLLVGGPERIADDIEHWFLAGAADGFNLMADSYPDGLERFVDHVVPLLQEKGIYRRDYETSLLNARFAGVRRGSSELREQLVR
jgi:FMN-dependent oxidoreductase (nitrilotriacetate monooxygenase family)